MQAAKNTSQLVDDNIRLNKENQNLNNTILQLKAMRECKEYVFYSDKSGLNYCLEGNYKKICIGYLDIINISEIYIYKGAVAEKFYYISYTTSGEAIHYTTVRENELKSNSLHRIFTNFECRSKCSASVVNAFIRNKIADKGVNSVFVVPENPRFYVSNNTAIFYSGNSFQEQTLRKIIPDNILKYNIKVKDGDTRKSFSQLKQYISIDLNIGVLIILNFLGLISNILEIINEPFPQIVAITGKHANLDKIALNFLQIYNRPVLCSSSLSASKSEIKNALEHSKDNVVCFRDIALSDKESKRTDSINLLVDDVSCGNHTPHMIAVISDAAPYIIPNERLLCVSFSEEILKLASTEMLNEIGMAVEDMDSYIIKIICHNYIEFLGLLKEKVSYYKSNAPDNLGFYGCRTYALLRFAVDFFNKIGFSMPVKELNEHFIRLLTVSFSYDTDNNVGIVNDFSTQLNNALKYGIIDVTEYGKDMAYSVGSDTVIRKDNMFIFEEKVFTDIILSGMTHTQSLLHTLQALDSEGVLVKNKKNRFSLTVYDSEGHSVRKDFIAILYSSILDTDTLEMLENNENREYFFDTLPHGNFLPMICNSSGKVAGKEIRYIDKSNLHISVTGKSGSGKTVFLCQLLCSMQKLGDKVVVFDTSDSFSYDELCRNLSKDYVDDNITFHNIEDDKIPVKIFNFAYCSNLADKKKLIAGILTAPIENLSQNQITVLKKYISECKLESFEFAELLDKLEKDDKTALSLYSRLEPVFGDIIEYDESDYTWGEFIDNSKGIIVISMSSDFSNSSNQLIDMLISSLYSYQIKNSDRQLDIFIDEIQNQNLSENAPIARIMKEGRKHHVSLISATQISTKGSSSSDKIMKQAETFVFFKPDSSSRTVVADMLNLKKGEMYKLDELQRGECIIKSELYNDAYKYNSTAVIKGKTYLHFNSFENNG